MKKMVFWNVRRKFATNSSSSHSMLVMDQPLPEESSSSDGYGWDNFTLVRPESKKDYLRLLLGSALTASNGLTVAQAVLEDLGLGAFDPDKDEGVDHQSQVYLPVSGEENMSNLEFVKELVGWVMQDQVAILGGNDNSEGHPSEEDGVNVPLRYWLSDQNLVAWKDQAQNAWSLFSRKNGLTLRFSFEDVSEAYRVDPYTRRSEAKSLRPNLVDVKITDRCPFGCTYCYQGSTPQGVHASLEDITRIANALQKEQVFEVALGGGEPTLHPDFDQIVDIFLNRGITPNVTTRNLSWLKSPNTQTTIGKLGGVAVSVDNVAQLTKTLDAFAQSSVNQKSVQFVVGAQGEEEFKTMMRLAMQSRTSMTLLGYKTTGFGQAFKEGQEDQIRLAHEKWAEWLQEEYKNYAKNPYDRVWFSIDTALAQVSDAQLQVIAQNSNMYHETEGTTSMYIDAVKNTMAPSSFAPQDEYRAFDENWLFAYQQIRPQVKKMKR